MDLFVYGWLRHVPLLEVVSGVSGLATRMIPARCDRVRACTLAAGAAPTLCDIATAGELGATDQRAVPHVDGMIVPGLDARAFARIDYYQRAFGLERVVREVLDKNDVSRPVHAYVAVKESAAAAIEKPLGAHAWDFEVWVAKFGEISTRAAREAMALIDTTSAQDMRRRHASMMARAASCARARKSRAGGDLGRADVNLIRATTPYSGFSNLQDLDLTFRKFDGAMSDHVHRTVLVGVDCVIVLPYDPARDRVLLIEQFRPGAFVRGDPAPWTIEPIAGRIDPGETPEQAGLREAHEEAGVTLRDLRQVAAAYPSPGTTSEFFFVFVGLCDLPDGTAGLGGEASEAEDIRSRVLQWDAFDSAVAAGELNVLPLIAAAHWLARNRDALRASG